MVYARTLFTCPLQEAGDNGRCYILVWEGLIANMLESSREDLEKIRAKLTLLDARDHFVVCIKFWVKRIKNTTSHIIV